jgi:tRNA 5-methylaminomethyl-2-thiouridine biosynthesis bifunctional protein
MLSALGSRGLTLAHAMGELLARLIEGEDPNLEADLLRALDPARFAWKQARRQPA